MWNITVDRGTAVTVEQLVDLCTQHFFKGKPCIGCPQHKNEEGEEFVVSQTPIPRKISTHCHKVLGTAAKLSHNRPI